jgi:hypothetical protein
MKKPKTSARMKKKKKVVKPSVMESVFSLLKNPKDVGVYLLGVSIFLVSVGITASPTATPFPTIVFGNGEVPLITVYDGKLQFNEPPCKAVEILKQLKDPQGALPWVEGMC